MIETRSTLLGLTQINGSFEIHFSYFLVILLYLNSVGLPTDASVDAGTTIEYIPDIRPQMLITHGVLATICFLNVSPRFASSALAMLANFFCLILYVGMIISVAV